jgi:uncharacterized protein HemX
VAGAVILAAVLLLGLMLLAYWPKARQAEHTCMQALAAGMLERFSDAELTAELHRRLKADPKGFARRVKSGEHQGKAAEEMLATELSRAKSTGYALGYSDGSFFSH